MSKPLPETTSISLPSQAARRLAGVWLCIVLCIVGYDLWLWRGDHLQLDTDILAMLPQNERDPTVQNATRQLADTAARRIVTLVGGPDWPSARQAGDAYAQSLGADSRVAIRYRVDDAAAEQWLQFFTPYQGQLLSSEQRRLLQTHSRAQLADRAIEALYRPFGMPRVGAWRDDPLNLFGGWLAARAAESQVRVRDGRLSLSSGGREYALIMLEQQGPAFSIAAQQSLVPQLEHARTQAMANGANIAVFTIGVPLYAAAAAAQAEREVHTIGVGSLIGIVILTLFAFSALRPRLLVTLSIAIGLAAALAACALLFQKLHLITLVFGASLVGVAENYGTNYYSNRLGRPPETRWTMLREQAPVMWLAMLTTAIGYALLALTPFPGLRQIAVFSAVGLLAAFVTTLWWFPFLDGGHMQTTPLSRWIGSRRANWPALGRNRFTIGFALLVTVLLAAGAIKLHANDDIRLLQSAPAALVKQQLAVNALLDLPGPAQFFLVQGADAEAVLQREEALKAQLDRLVAEHNLRGYQALSDWVPSASQQRANATLIQNTLGGEQGVLAIASAKLGESMASPAPKPFAPLTLEAWLNAPVSEPLRHQWLGRFADGYASVLLLRGAENAQQLATLSAVAPKIEGVRWVDKVAEVSSIMARYRLIMGWVIVFSYLLVFAALSLRFGRRAWRALLPTALASTLALAILALIGAPLQLFNILALLLILGMGVDYGIFLLENPGRQETRPFLSVTLAAASTLLAFGLLALSTTPALRAFGLTMLFGIGLAWLLTPAFMPSGVSQQET